MLGYDGDNVESWHILCFTVDQIIDLTSSNSIKKALKAGMSKICPQIVSGPLEVLNARIVIFLLESS